MNQSTSKQQGVPIDQAAAQRIIHASFVDAGQLAYERDLSVYEVYKHSKFDDLEAADNVAQRMEYTRDHEEEQQLQNRRQWNENRFNDHIASYQLEFKMMILLINLLREQQQQKHYTYQ
jgi:hypothetical protein